MPPPAPAPSPHLPPLSTPRRLKVAQFLRATNLDQHIDSRAVLLTLMGGAGGRDNAAVLAFINPTPSNADRSSRSYQRLAIDLLVEASDFHVAARLVCRFGLANDIAFRPLLNRHDRPSATPPALPDGPEEDGALYHNEDSTPVTLVVDAHGLHACRVGLFGHSGEYSGGGASVVGLDSEWRPRTDDTRTDSTRVYPVALVQCATRQHVWLLDVMALTDGGGGGGLRSAYESLMVSQKVACQGWHILPMSCSINLPMSCSITAAPDSPARSVSVAADPETGLRLRWVWKWGGGGGRLPPPRPPQSPPPAPPPTLLLGQWSRLVRPKRQV